MASKNEKASSAYQRARKRVNAIKGFYGHLVLYLVVNAIVLFTPGKFIPIGEVVFGKVDFLSWINWETFGTPLLWGIGLIIHALTVFAYNPILNKNWEERQIQKYMDEDQEQTQSYQ